MNGTVGLAVVTITFDGRRLQTTAMLPVEARSLGLAPRTHRIVDVLPQLGTGADDWRWVRRQADHAARWIGDQVRGAWGGTLPLFDGGVDLLHRGGEGRGD
jgi:hypothetical protein